MTNKTERLKKLDDNKLIDIVKNYRQYGYHENMRKTAISILTDRGIDEEQLKLTGQFENQTYQSADQHFQSFKKNSTTAFTLYILTVLVLFVFPWIISGLEFGLTLLILAVIFGIGYIIYLLKSFTNQDSFYKVVGAKDDSEGALLYFLLGMPLYVLMFFYFNNRMKEQMKRIK